MEEKKYVLVIETEWDDKCSVETFTAPFLRATEHSSFRIPVEIYYKPRIKFAFNLSRIRSVLNQIKICAPRIASCSIFVHPETSPKLIQRFNKLMTFCRPSFPIEVSVEKTKPL